MGNATRELFTTVRAEQDRQVDRPERANEHARARARLLQAIDREPNKREPSKRAPQASGRRPWSWELGVGAAVAACAIALISFDTFVDRGLDRGLDPVEVGQVEAPALGFQVDGLELAVDQALTTEAGAELVAVSDSTRIEVGPRSQMFVDAVRPNGASIVLEHGELALAVHHEHDTSWQVAAGPWTVHVTGTQFVVAWEPSSARFQVAVTEGSVRVEGPATASGSGEVVRLRAGDSLIRGGVPVASLLVPGFDSAAGSSSQGAELGGAEPGGAGLGGAEPGGAESGDARPAGSKRTKVSAPTWTRYFDDADYQAAWTALADLPGGIHAEAERVGDAKTLLDLADVARFTKHAADTRKLLQRLRTRFPNTHEAGDAAFALGRIDADGGSRAQAAVWFERYLDERPTGSFAGDALGRLIDCYSALGQTDDAKAAARRYLASHPQGPHASKAESCLHAGCPAEILPR